MLKEPLMWVVTLLRHMKVALEKSDNKPGVQVFKK